MNSQDLTEAESNFNDYKIWCNQQNISIQPKIHFIGNPITVAQLVICDNKYLYDKPLDAVENYFFFFTALNIDYPVAANVVWNLIGELIFNLKSKELKGAARTILNDIISRKI